MHQPEDKLLRKTVVITGASSGIGAALATALAAQDRVLILLGRDERRLRNIADVCSLKGALCKVASIDICDRVSMAAFLQSVDREYGIDSLILNAGIMNGRPADDTVETALSARRVLEVNLMSAIDTLYLALPGMRQRRRGEIVFMASLSGFAPLMDAPAYSASKAALISYGLALRDSLSAEGIKVVVACPGYVTTPLVSKHRGSRPGEVSIDYATRQILRGLSANRALIGFPMPLYWLSKISLLAPEFMRRKVMSLFRFYIEA